MRIFEFSALTLAACLTLPAHASDEVTVQLVARDGRFFPSELTVPPGRKIRIEIRNDGKDPVEFESTELRKEKVLAPGSKSVVVIFPQQAGRYKFFDDFHPVTGQGALVVQ
ncbi:MAG: cupredoxin domain-containing protein [Formivibrio sp.]|nr:cupredoxin domain-containing protein [Formivibrio sp.]